jgi:hypothetical protein
MPESPIYIPDSGTMNLATDLQDITYFFYGGLASRHNKRTVKVFSTYRVDKMPLLSLKTVDDGEQVIVYNHQGNTYCTILLYIPFNGTVA